MARRKNLHPQHKVTAKSLANLRPIKKGELSTEEAKERGRKGGRQSVLKFQTEKQLVEAVILLLNKKIADKYGEEMTIWEAALNTAGKEGITNGRGAMEFIRLAMGLVGAQNPKEQTINLIQHKDKETIASELKVAQDIIRQLKK